MGKELKKNLFWGNLNMVQIYGERTKVNALAPKISNLTQLANEYWSHEDTNNYAKITWKISKINHIIQIYNNETYVYMKNEE